MADADGVAAAEVICADDRRGWGAATPVSIHRVYITRSGGYLGRINGETRFVDATTALVIRPGDEMSVAHPLGGGDTGTIVDVSATVAAQMEADGMWPVSGELRLDDQLDLIHRGLLAASRRGLDPFEAAERLLSLLRAVAARGAPRVEGRWRAETVLAHRRLVDRAREALVEGRLAVGLAELADTVACSPHHLSRVFRRVTGEPLTAYRNRLRVRAVLSDLQDGAACLRVLAAEYGFADQAHLTRVVRRQLGCTPTELRRLVA
jgi:AraC-like DNA-binding protein